MPFKCDFSQTLSKRDPHQRVRACSAISMLDREPPQEDESIFLLSFFILAHAIIKKVNESTAKSCDLRKKEQHNETWNILATFAQFPGRMGK